MIISRTPFRISFFGGGTDYLTYFKDNPGASLVTTINKYTYLTARWLPPFFDFKYRVVYSKVEDVNEVKLIQHPSVRECLKYLKIEDGIEIHPAADLPARAGLGSSSTFTVGLLHALHALLGNSRSKKELAEEAIHIEQDMCGDCVGCQDQLSVAIGGLNHFKYKFKDGKPNYTIEKVKVGQDRIKELDSHLLLYFTGFSRNASEIAEHQVKNIPDKKKELVKMYEMVQQGVDIIHNGDLRDFGLLLHDSWQLKRSLSDKISNPLIDEIYEVAIMSGALGGKINGAGGGGFLLLFVEPEKQDKVKENLKKLSLDDKFKKLIETPFTMENTGTELLVNSSDDNGKT